MLRKAFGQRPPSRASIRFPTEWVPHCFYLEVFMLVWVAVLEPITLLHKFGDKCANFIAGLADTCEGLALGTL